MRFFTADWHLGHTGALRFRPGFDSVDQMNNLIEDLYHETVTDDDEVWVLGDVTLGQAGTNLKRIAEWPGRKILVCGNHDPCRIGSRKKVPSYMQAFDLMLDEAVVRIGERLFDVSHYPYYGDHTEEDRKPHRRPTDKGRWLLHGHVHSLWGVRDRMINVGVDVNGYRPVSDEQILRHVS